MVGGGEDSVGARRNEGVEEEGSVEVGAPVEGRPTVVQKMALRRGRQMVSALFTEPWFVEWCKDLAKR